MVTHFTKDLKGTLLDWAVAQCIDGDYRKTRTTNGIGMEFEATHYSTDWSIAGPIIQDNDISIVRLKGDYWNGSDIPEWGAVIGKQYLEYAYGPYHETDDVSSVQIYQDQLISGPTALVAAMRCFVNRVWGDSIDLPEGLT